MTFYRLISVRSVDLMQEYDLTTGPMHYFCYFYVIGLGSKSKSVLS